MYHNNSVGVEVAFPQKMMSDQVLLLEQRVWQACHHTMLRVPASPPQIICHGCPLAQRCWDGCPQNSLYGPQCLSPGKKICTWKKAHTARVLLPDWEPATHQVYIQSTVLVKCTSGGGLSFHILDVHPNAQSFANGVVQVCILDACLIYLYAYVLFTLGQRSRDPFAVVGGEDTSQGQYLPSLGRAEKGSCLKLWSVGTSQDW